LHRNEEYVLRVLEDVGLVTHAQIDSARARVNGAGDVVSTLVRDGIVTETDVSRTLATQAHMDWVDLSPRVIPGEVISQLRAEDARRLKVVPVGFGETGLIVAVSDPLDIDTIDSLSFLLQQEVELVCTSPDQIREALVKYYGTADDASDMLAQRLGGELDAGLEITEGGPVESGDEGDAPIIRMVSMLLVEGHRLGASDIHLEPLEKKFRVRFRIDGVLQEMQSPPKRLQSAIVSRLKIMTGSMSIAEKRLPQDGRIQVKVAGKPLDLRVSTIPTNHGESVVMRLLDKSSLVLGLPELGFLSDDQETFERLLRLPDGILLVTGPTGSGKRARSTPASIT
jgi:type II secretory ATPase GspE/PulE/Tfp pilus assembly ATPase PilB-like protein